MTCGMVDVKKFREEHMQEEIVNDNEPSEHSDNLDKEIHENAFGFQELGDQSQTIMGNLSDITGFDKDQTIIDPEDIEYVPKQKSQKSQLLISPPNNQQFNDESEGGTP